MRVRSVSFRLLALVSMLGLAVVITPMDDAMASYYHPWVRQSHVVSNVSSNAGAWDYTYTLFNDSYEDGSKAESGPMPIIVDWELPWFADANITNILSPAGWFSAIETIGTPNAEHRWDGIAAWQDSSDSLYQGANSPFTTVTEVLHWYTLYEDFNPEVREWFSGLPAHAIYPVFDPPVGQTSLTGFGFTAIYSPTDAPYQASWAYLPQWTGDPAYPLGGVPGSPDTLGATSVPEPTTMLLLGLGLVGLAGVRKRMRSKEAQ